jgi:predicted dehydrogenase
MTFSEANPAGVGVIGAGNIARHYVEGMARFPQQLKLIGVTDLAQPLADKLAAEAGVTLYGSLQEIPS